MTPAPLVPGPVAPDFGQPVEGSGGRCFRAAGAPGCYVAIPRSLGLRGVGGEDPGLRITYVRGSNPMLPPRPYALVEFSLGTHGPDEESLRRVRGVDPEASIRGAVAQGGWLRWSSAPEIELPSGLREPRALAWNELGRSRAQFRLRTAEADLLRGGIEGGALLVSASAWLTVPGRSPVFPGRVSFDPSDLLTAANPLIRKGTYVLDRPQVVSGVLRLLDAHSLSLEDEAEVPDKDRSTFAEALADAFLTRHGEPVGPPDDDDGRPGYAMHRSRNRERWHWTVDLSRPVTATRIYAVELDPMAEARDGVGGAGADRIVRSVVVPAFDPGGRVVEVGANLPPLRVGVLQLGAVLSAPPNPPGRVDPIVETVRFGPSEDTGRAVLRFGPGEPGSFEVTSFAVVRRGQEVVRLDGPSLPGSERTLLQPQDFPVAFASIEADPGLLAVADVVLEFFPGGDPGPPERFALGAGRPAVALAVESGEEVEALEVEGPPPREARLEVEATPRDGRGGALRLGPFPVRSLALGLHLFPDYGPRSVELVLAESEAGPVAVDLRAEGEPFPEFVTVALTRGRPRRTWTYFADTPFRPGYCWRPHREGQDPSEAWRGPLDPDIPLRLGTVEVDAPAPGVR